MSKTLEQKVSATLLQKDKTLIIGGLPYRVPKPTVATLIRASESISKLPDMKLDKEKKVTDILRSAKECHALGDVLATLIVGSRWMRIPLLGRIIASVRMRMIAKKILETSSPSDMKNALFKLLSQAEISDFFTLIAFLNEVNMTKATTTASGQQ